MNAILEKIGELGIVPVVRIENAADAVPLGKALLAGDLPIAEITFRTAAAEQAIRTLVKDLPEIMVGAGTVLTVDQVKKAVDAGAQFIVSPGFNPKVVDYCLENKIVVTPGINNPTGLEAALERGLEVVKFFPAEASGGVRFLKDMAAPYGKVKFIPTGGINISNMNTYLSEPSVFACAGSWMVSPQLIAEKKFAEITRLTREAVLTMLGFEFSHVGIALEASEAKTSAERLASIFAFPIKESGQAFLIGKGVELLKEAPEQQSYIAVATNHIARAAAYFNRKNIPVAAETRYEEGGKVKSVSLKMEISGFGIKVVQK